MIFINFTDNFELDDDGKIIDNNIRDMVLYKYEDLLNDPDKLHCQLIPCSHKKLKRGDVVCFLSDIQHW